MPKYPICQTEYIEEKVECCSVCEWDLRPHLRTFEGQIPDAFSEKVKANLDWAKRILPQQIKLKDERDKLAEKNKNLTEKISELSLEIGSLQKKLLHEKEQLALTNKKLVRQNNDIKVNLKAVKRLQDKDKDNNNTATNNNLKKQIDNLQQKLNHQGRRSYWKLSLLLTFANIILDVKGLKEELKQAQETIQKPKAKIDGFKTNSDQIAEDNKKLKQQLLNANNSLQEKNVYIWSILANVRLAVLVRIWIFKANY